jgi:exodeoxyribonuclease VII small subunit
MAEKKSTDKTYQELSDELAQIMDWFESGSVDLDEALSKYEEAMKILGQMETHLQNVQNKIKKITARLSP